MGKLKHAVLVVTLVMLAMAVSSLATAASQEGQPQGEPQGEPPPPPTLRQIPGLTAPDQFPRGCVDCHIDRPELKMDTRISTLMQQWQVEVDPAFLAKVRAFSPADMPLKGKHPKIGDQLTKIEIPTTCLKCHSRTSKFAPPFSQLLHGLHLVGGEKNHFLSMFQGECTYCHKLDAATGSWSLGTGTEQE